MDFCPIMAKRYLIEYIVMSHKLRYILDNIEDNHDDIKLREYLSRLAVTFRDRLPTITPDGPMIDHDGGSAYYDVNLDKVFPL